MKSLCIVQTNRYNKSIYICTKPMPFRVYTFSPYTFSVENGYIYSTSNGFLFLLDSQFCIKLRTNAPSSLYAKFFFITAKFFFITYAMQNKSQSKLGRLRCQNGKGGGGQTESIPELHHLCGLAGCAHCI